MTSALTTLTPDVTTIFMAILFLLLGLIIMTQFMNKVGNMTGGAGLTFTKWLVLLVIGGLFIWGLYNRIGQESGMWGSVTLDKYLGSITQAIYQFIANIVLFFKNLLARKAITLLFALVYGWF